MRANDFSHCHRLFARHRLSSVDCAAVVVVHKFVFDLRCIHSIEYTIYSPLHIDVYTIILFWMWFGFSLLLFSFVNFLCFCFCTSSVPSTSVPMNPLASWRFQVLLCGVTICGDDDDDGGGDGSGGHWPTTTTMPSTRHSLTYLKASVSGNLSNSQNSITM